MKRLSKFNLTKEQTEKISIYIDMLLEWNEKFNLTSIIDKNDIIVKHFYDSLALLEYIDLNSQSLCDVGSGAGFPGIPLAIACPNLKITLLESNNKKTKFLNEVIKQLSLKNVTVINERCETCKLVENFDFVVARAVKQLNILLEITTHLAKIDGKLIFYKGNSDLELKQAKNATDKLSLKFERKIDFHLPDIDNSTRSFLIFNKIAKTNKKYPRNYSEICKSPL